MPTITYLLSALAAVSFYAAADAMANKAVVRKYTYTIIALCLNVILIHVHSTLALAILSLAPDTDAASSINDHNTLISMRAYSFGGVER